RDAADRRADDPRGDLDARNATRVIMSDRTLRTPTALNAAGLISGDVADDARDVADRYAIAVTPEMADLIGRERAHDPATALIDGPIARQFLPDPRELIRRVDERTDPIGDDAHSPVPHLVHRYRDRVLLKPISVCPVYCRFCFRREMVGPGKLPPARPADLDRAYAYIAADPNIWEVIITGGDPLMLSPDRIRQINAALTAIPHVRIIRWHTRVPVVDTRRITLDLACALAGPIDDGRMVYLAVHTNHASELTPAAATGITRLRRAGISLISQTVLLRGVNDTVAALATLMRRLVEVGVKPYYLHQLDRAPGTAHFEVPLAEARALVAGLRGDVSGLCQPTFVLDIPGGAGKTVAAAEAVALTEPEDGGGWDGADMAFATATDRKGRAHRYAVDRAPLSTGGVEAATTRGDTGAGRRGTSSGRCDGDATGGVAGGRELPNGGMDESA
ncbi:MAG: lysine-2,3-aminomutase-like protein, partial [Pseudomonadota bacterium]